MRIRRDPEAFQRSVPTGTSLAFAEQIAALTDLPFDRQEVEAQSHRLHETMFDKLCSILDLKQEAPAFQSGYFLSARAFSIHDDDGAPHIGLDITFDYWLSALCLLSAISTFTAPSKDEWSAILRETDATFRLFDDATRFVAAREGLKPLLAKHHALLNMSEGLARAMLVYALCHELAHCRLGHLNLPQDPAQELEADREGARLFQQVIAFGKQDNQTTIHIDPKLAGAPIILSHLLELHEAWLKRQGRPAEASSTHPSAAARRANLEPILLPFEDRAATEILDAMAAGIHDLQRLISGDAVL